MAHQHTPTTWWGTTLMLALLLTLPITSSFAQTIYGLSGNNLLRFEATAPATVTDIAAISGINSTLEVVGLDSRPATGQLYALAYNNGTGMAQLYTLNTTTAVATAIGAAPVMLQANMGKVSMDFNPVVDRIRVLGSNNANYRMHPMTGAVVATDGNLAFAANDVNAGKNPSIGAGAYTNSFIGSSSTTLINHDDSLQIFCTQVPPNNGTLNTIGSTEIQVDLTDTHTDFDIYFDGALGKNIGYFVATLAASTTSSLFQVNLNTGVAMFVGNIGANDLIINDIAVKIAPPSNAPITGELAYAITSAATLISFDTDSPGLVRSQASISGLAMGQVLVGFDCRPATGELYGLGYNATNTESQIYTINRVNGVCTPVGMAPFPLALGSGTAVGFDFNPVVDRIRVVAASNANYRLHPVTGALAATDMNLAFATTDPNAATNPAVGAGAYTNSFNGTTATQLLVIDDSLNVLCLQNPPNNGTLNTLGSTNILQSTTDISADLDIFYDLNTATNRAYAVANATGTALDMLYRVNTTNGAFTPVGKIGLGISVRDLAISIDSIPPTSSVFEAPKTNLPIAIAPNPVSDAATLRFDLPETGHVRAVVTDLLGREVTTLSDQRTSAGAQIFQWSMAGQPKGFYAVQVRVDGQLRGIAKLLVE